MELQDILAKPNITVVDVREPLEFFFGRVKGSKNVPLSRLDQRLNELRDLPGPIVLVCQSGNRSGQALRFLKSKGFKNVYNGGSWMDIKRFRRAR